MAKLVQKSLNDVDYPAPKQDWIEHAKNNRDEMKRPFKYSINYRIKSIVHQ